MDEKVEKLEDQLGKVGNMVSSLTETVGKFMAGSHPNVDAPMFVYGSA